MNPDLLSSLSFPATKTDVVAEAEAQGAPQEVLDALQAAGRESFESVDDVLEAVRA